MVHRSHSNRPRRYQPHESNANRSSPSHAPTTTPSTSPTHNEHNRGNDHKHAEVETDNQCAPQNEHRHTTEDNTRKPFNFLSSIFGSGGPRENSEGALFKILNYDIYLDDLLLVGLVVLLFTDQMQDEILLIVLLYLLLDIF